jgi:hypothetical protein
MTRRFTSDEHGQVTAAVAQAERGTDSEIVTIVTDWSDHYHDVSLYYAGAVMLAALGVFAAFPGLLDAKLALFTGGWGEAERHLQLALLVVVQAALFLAVRFGFEALPFRGLLIPSAVRGRLRRLRGAAPQQGPHAGEQFGEPEGLGDVVVGARVQTDDGVHLVGTRGQDEDGHGMALGTQPAGHFEAVHAGQAQVEHDQVDTALESGVDRGGSVLTHLDLVPFPAQSAGQRLRDGRIVLGEQYTGHDLMVDRS